MDEGSDMDEIVYTEIKIEIRNQAKIQVGNACSGLYTKEIRLIKSVQTYMCSGLGKGSLGKNAVI